VDDEVDGQIGAAPGRAPAARYRAAATPVPSDAFATTGSETSGRIAAFFDLDKTIIAGSSTLAFSRPMRAKGLIDRRAMLRSGYAQLTLMRSGADADFMDRMRDQISALCTGWDAALVRSVIEESLPTVLMPMIYAEAAELVERHRAGGHHVALVSASGHEMVSPVADALGAEHCVATRMVVADGRYTGEIEFYCYGEGKAVAARRLAAEHGYRLEDSYAYSDSVTDLPLLEVVGHPHAVNPDKALRKVAEERGWPVLEFTAPIPLFSRVGARLRGLFPVPTDAVPDGPVHAGHGPAQHPAASRDTRTPTRNTAARTAAWGIGGVAAAVALSVAWRELRRTPAALPGPLSAALPGALAASLAETLAESLVESRTVTAA
jgi:HAD superfamily hydrolase (TIGR01490 family)